jgi:TPR repeat protein
MPPDAKLEAKYQRARELLSKSGDPASLAKGIRLAQEAAAAGHSEALYAMHYWLIDGQVLRRDKAKALDCLKRSARQGLGEAQNDLAVRCHYGIDLPLDVEQARYWYQLAADQGQLQAANNLGLMCLEGEGGPKDAKKAAKLFRFAGERGDGRGWFNLARMHGDGESLPLDLVAAGDYMRRGAELGWPGAEMSLGNYCLCVTSPPDYPEAAKWLQKAAEHGIEEASLYLALMAFYGLGQASDEKRALKEILLLAQKGLASAQYVAGTFYGQGRGLPQSQAESRKWLQKAENSGFSVSEALEGPLGFFEEAGAKAMAAASMEPPAGSPNPGQPPQALQSLSAESEKEPLAKSDWRRAPEGADPEDRRRHGLELLEKLSAGERPSPEAEEAALEAALGYIVSAAESGCAEASFDLYQIYAQGRFSVKKDQALAMRHLRRAADSGSPEARKIIEDIL